MADVHKPETRSRNMAAIKSRHTQPELVVRKALHASGLRYRLHVGNLAGKPDIIFPKYSAVVFVHGCFWHHHNCHLFRWPSTRQDFWHKKITGNVAKDQRVAIDLQSAGWRVATVWECALKGRTRLNFPDAMQDLIDWIKGTEQVFTVEGK